MIKLFYRLCLINECFYLTLHYSLLNNLYFTDRQFKFENNSYLHGGFKYEIKHQCNQ